MIHELGEKWSLPVTTTFMLEINLNNISKVSLLMLFRIIIASYTKNHMELINNAAWAECKEVLMCIVATVKVFGDFDCLCM